MKDKDKKQKNSEFKTNKNVDFLDIIMSDDSSLYDSARRKSDLRKNKKNTVKSDELTGPAPKKPGFWTRDNKRNIKRLVIILLVIIFIASVAIGLVIAKKLNLINFDDNGGLDFQYASESFEVEDEDLAFEPMHDVTDANSIKDWLYKWATNGGEKLYSKNIINCLLLGIDSEDGSISGGRADAILLVSLNKKTDKITIVSFMRDSYTYMDINGESRYYKVNSAFNWGGPATILETFENNYKIEIDGYVCVDFVTFPKLIDSLGGVTVEVQDYEAKYINRTSSQHIESGDAVTLTGKQALVFSRIRHSDSDGDISRTRRQRQVIMALIESVKDASAGQLNNMLNIVLPCVRTNYTRSQILSLGTQALIQDWMSYEMKQIVSPLVIETDEEDTITGKDSYIYTGYGSVPEFVWIIDYQLAARRIQTALYGITNIELHDDRTSPFDFVTATVATTASYSESTTNSYNEDSGDGESEEGGGYSGGFIGSWFSNRYTTTTTTAPYDFSEVDGGEDTNDGDSGSGNEWDPNFINSPSEEN